MNIVDWMKVGGHLPRFMRDFHDQKRLFKHIDEMVASKRSDPIGQYLAKDLPNPISAHVYVIDYFLWFMARRGYTLQRARQKFEFVDLDADLQDFERRLSEQVAAEIAYLNGQQGE